MTVRAYCRNVGGLRGEAALLQLCYKRPRVGDCAGGDAEVGIALSEALNNGLLARLQWYDDRNTLVVSCDLIPSQLAHGMTHPNSEMLLAWLSLYVHLLHTVPESMVVSHAPLCICWLQAE